MLKATGQNRTLLGLKHKTVHLGFKHPELLSKTTGHLKITQPITDKKTKRKDGNQRRNMRDTDEEASGWNKNK